MTSPTATPASGKPIPTAGEQLELFCGEANTAEARIYARWTIDDREPQQAVRPTISGQLIGPSCEFSHTLPANHPFREIDRGDDLQSAALAEAIMPDPCFWTPDLPFLYRAQMQVHRGIEVVEVDRIVGIRRLGVRGKSLFFDGKRFVLRALECKMQNAELKSFLEHNQDFLRETWTALILENPGDEVCEFASRRGILIVADLQATDDSLLRSLRRLARWPAIGIAIIAGHDAVSANRFGDISTLLLAQIIAAEQQLTHAPWADLLFVEATQPADFHEKTAGLGVPVVAVRRRSAANPIEQARAACDILQSDLAPFGRLCRVRHMKIRLFAVENEGNSDEHRWTQRGRAATKPEKTAGSWRETKIFIRKPGNQEEESEKVHLSFPGFLASLYSCLRRLCWSVPPENLREPERN